MNTIRILAQKLLMLTFLVPIVLLNCSNNTQAKGTTAGAVTIRDNDIVLGNTNARIVIVEYLDIQCPACAYWHTLLDRTWRLVEDDVTLVLRHYPLTNIHPHALNAAKYIEAAREQGDAYYTLYEKMMENQDQWSQKNTNDAIDTFKNYAQEAGLDWDKLVTLSEKRSIANKIESDIELGKQDNVTGTPTILINNQKISVPRNAQELYNIIQEALKKTSAS